MTLNELIDVLIKLQQEGYGEKQCIFDEFYNVNDAEYNSEMDEISLY